MEQERGSRAEERQSAVGQSYGMTEGMEGAGGGGEGGALWGTKANQMDRLKKKEECGGVRRDHAKDRMGGGLWLDGPLWF